MLSANASFRVSFVMYRSLNVTNDRYTYVYKVCYQDFPTGQVQGSREFVYIKIMPRKKWNYARSVQTLQFLFTKTKKSALDTGKHKCLTRQVMYNTWGLWKNIKDQTISIAWRTKQSVMKPFSPYLCMIQKSINRTFLHFTSNKIPNYRNNVRFANLSTMDV